MSWGIPAVPADSFGKQRDSRSSGHTLHPLCRGFRLASRVACGESAARMGDIMAKDRENDKSNGDEKPGGEVSLKKAIKRAHEFAAPYRVDNGKKFRLKDVDPGDTAHLHSVDKARSKEALTQGVQALAKLQDMLYAQDRWSVLCVFQAMDAAGKDGAIKHVMSGVNPQGCQVYSFKSPTSEDLDHDFLWRCARALPERGRIGIFNRSYYE